MIARVLLILFARGPPPVGDTNFSRGSLVKQTLMPAGPGFDASSLSKRAGDARLGGCSILNATSRSKDGDGGG